MFVQRMYSLGARKIVVASLGPLGCVPFQLTFRLSKNGECSQKVDAEVIEFNAGVLGLVKELNANLPGLTVVYADAYKAVSEVISNPRAYGEYIRMTITLEFQSTFNHLIYMHKALLLQIFTRK